MNPVPDHEGDIPVARRTDPATSHQAAASVAHVRESQRRVYKIIQSLGGQASDTEIRQVAKFQKWMVSDSGLRTRRRELVDKQRLADSGLRRQTDSGRSTIVWKIVAPL